MIPQRVPHRVHVHIAAMSHGRNLRRRQGQLTHLQHAHSRQGRERRHRFDDGTPDFEATSQKNAAPYQVSMGRRKNNWSSLYERGDIDGEGPLLGMHQGAWCGTKSTRYDDR